MNEVKLKAVFDDSEIIQGWKRIQKETMTSAEIAESYDDIIRDMTKSVGQDFVKATDKANQKNKEFLQTMNREQKEAQMQIKSAAKEMKFFGLSISDIQNKTSGLNKIPKAFNAGSKSAKLFWLALGPIGIAVTALIALLTRTQKGMDFVSRSVEAANEAFSTITDTLSSVGSAIVNFFKGDKQAAIDDLKKAGKEMAGIGDDIKKAWDLEQASQKLRDDAEVINRQVAKNRDQIKKLNQTAEDTTKSFKERANAAKKAGDLEKENISNRLSLIDREIAILEGKKELGETLAKDEAKLTELLQEKSAISQESTELQTTLGNKLNTINDQRIALIEREREAIRKLNDEYLARTQKLGNELLQIELSKLDPVARLQREKEIAIEALKEERDEVIALADQIGQSVEDVRKDYETLITETTEAFVEEIDKIQTKYSEIADIEPLEVLNVKPVSPQVELLLDELEVIKAKIETVTDPRVRAALEEQAQKLSEAIGSFLPDGSEGQPELEIVDPEAASKQAQDAIDAINEVFGSAEFGLALDWAEEILYPGFKDDVLNVVDNLVTIIEDSDLASRLGATFAIAGSFISAFSSGIDSQIEDLERLREAREEKISDLEDQLATEQDFQEKGLANNVETIQQSLDAEVAKRKEADAKILELKKKRVQAELAQNIAQQGSELLLAIAKVQSAHSGIPFIGVALAAGFILNMIANFKAAKNQIKALQTDSLYTGGSMSDVLSVPGPTRDGGFVKRGGKSDRPGMHSGYAVVDADTGEDTRLRVGGNEMVVNEQASNEHFKFLEDMNKGFYKDMDLTSMLAQKQIGIPVAQRTAINEVYQKTVVNQGVSEKAITAKFDQLDKSINNLGKKLDKIEKSNAVVIEDGEVLLIDPKSLNQNKSAILARRKVK